MTTKNEIENVSDTALWVAVYRGLETERPDSLFKDPLAMRLAGARGRAIATQMSGSRYTSWGVVIRTCIIDRYIQNLVSEGVDTIINLGAGLDTRPYRLTLPPDLHWIEVDYPHMIELKNQRLAEEKPRCRLERVAIDLGDDKKRRAFLSDIGAQTKKALILTEGVIPYLTNEQVGSLARDLRQETSFKFWIVDYFSPQAMKYMMSSKRKKQMQNAPFQFLPNDWAAFFNEGGWSAKETRYMADESEKLGRAIPIPWWVYPLQLLPGAKKQQQVFRKLTAYVLLEPKRRYEPEPQSTLE